MTDNQTIAVDESENFSDYESIQSELSTESLTSSIYEYRFENGRRYHAYRDGKYLLPNDEKEQDRLDIIHHICLLMFEDKLHLAPIGDNPQNILDIGTGTGIWAIDCGERYPSAEVIGVDLSPIQPHWVPPNVKFQIDDAEQEWTWPENHFDFIHVRHMSGAIQDWPKLVKQAYKHLKPGGWLELNEALLDVFCDDGSLGEDTNLREYYKLLSEAGSKSGRDLRVAPHLCPLLKESRFENIHDQLFKLPAGTWPADRLQKQLGAYFLLVLDTGFEAYGMALLTRVLGMDQGEVTRIIDGAKKETKDRKIHCYVKQYIYYGQKPKEDESEEDEPEED